MMKTIMLQAKRTLNMLGILFIVFSIGLISCEDSNVNPMDDMEDPDDSGNNNMMDPDEEPAPGFALTSVNGETIKLSDFQDKVVVLFFLGNRCPSCLAIAPSIEAELHDPWRENENYEILGLDQWDGNETSLESFRTNTGVTFPLLLKASSVASDYNTTYDRLIVVGKDGNIKFKGVNNASADIDEVKELVDSLL